mmetsp:Transcript_107/g.123  ORF Transcript_107/g.123 Transcript_107/m.123 type:complete len:100 (+) Transcript_107:438-737(+)
MITTAMPPASSMTSSRSVDAQCAGSHPSKAMNTVLARQSVMASSLDSCVMRITSMICLKAVLKIGLTSSRVKVSSKNEPDITVLRLQGYSVSCDVFQQT